ncbi:hypothetical protein Tco_1287921, partial [Tanacetum coccineum]
TKEQQRSLLRIRAEEHLRKFARTLASSVGPEIPIYQFLSNGWLYEGSSTEEGENLNTGALGTRRTPLGGTSAPAGQAQGGLSPAFVKENIDVLRTMIKELDNRGQEKVTPPK